MRVGLYTLGCDKNTVDNEYLAGMLEDRGCEVDFIDDASGDHPYDAVVVTTCGFIGDAKKQSVEALLEFTERKKEGGYPRRVFAAGCLAQRYADDLLEELPHLDGLVGVGQYERLTELILDERAAPVRNVRDVPRVEIEHFMRRKRIDAKPYSFLKISDGCNHGCTFCSIPIMKGRHQSVPLEVLLDEARSLLDQGVKELVLVAQDLADYGRDGGQDCRLPDLLRALCALDGDFWVRCMYVYPMGITDEFLEIMASGPKIVPYLDVPLQHLDPDTLRRMNRPAKDVNTFKLVERIRARVPNIALRTTMIVGFPGETRLAHLNMLAGLKELRFNWLGAFQYSTEDGTPAGAMDGQLSQATRKRRWNAVMETQAEITGEWNRNRVGTRTRVLVESYDPAVGRGTGRTPAEAPEVDGNVLIESALPLAPGTFVEAEIVDSDTYDLHVQVVSGADIPLQEPKRGGR
ncbi:MAG: 30S ribosomal protein S12 methylthiotransferase RimO [Candidatus Hydrogenedentes bacterium]|nr:30S ribosomal protein S12 methylthiotransferase RimO [Candidatus Hydrogenedentota bacterium]